MKPSKTHSFRVGELRGNMVVSDEGDYYEMHCCKCHKEFKYCDIEGELQNYYFNRDFTVTAQCPKCHAIWDNPEELDESKLFIIDITYIVVSEDGKDLVDKKQQIPICGLTLLESILYVFHRAGETHRIESITAKPCDKEEFAEARRKSLMPVIAAAHELFEKLFGKEE